MQVAPRAPKRGWRVQVGTDARLNLDITGNAPLGLARPFLGSRDLQGQARFDLAVNGPAALSSITGSIQTSDATLSAPNLRVALQGIAANIRLQNSRAQLDVTGQAVNGGAVRVGGNVALTGALAADLDIGIENLVLTDPKLYRTSLNGALKLAGPLTGAAQISGRIDVGETEVSVPSTGLTSIGDIPPDQSYRSHAPRDRDTPQGRHRQCGGGFRRYNPQRSRDWPETFA
ncbi:hypothetical protein GQR58_029646 [Nymphon striatum]|nr:hypothetical protein GQR58_029646 [Nymphon striatum]